MINYLQEGVSEMKVKNLTSDTYHQKKQLFYISFLRQIQKF